MYSGHTLLTLSMSQGPYLKTMYNPKALTSFTTVVSHVWMITETQQCPCSLVVYHPDCFMQNCKQCIHRARSTQSLLYLSRARWLYSFLFYLAELFVGSSSPSAWLLIAWAFHERPMLKNFTGWAFMKFSTSSSWRPSMGFPGFQF